MDKNGLSQSEINNYVTSQLEKKAKGELISQKLYSQASDNQYGSYQEVFNAQMETRTEITFDVGDGVIAAFDKMKQTNPEGETKKLFDFMQKVINECTYTALPAIDFKVTKDINDASIRNDAVRDMFNNDISALPEKYKPKKNEILVFIQAYVKELNQQAKARKSEESKKEAEVIEQKKQEIINALKDKNVDAASLRSMLAGIFGSEDANLALNMINALVKKFKKKDGIATVVNNATFDNAFNIENDNNGLFYEDPKLKFSRRSESLQFLIKGENLNSLKEFVKHITGVKFR